MGCFYLNFARKRAVNSHSAFVWCFQLTFSNYSAPEFELKIECLFEICKEIKKILVGLFRNLHFNFMVSGETSFVPEGISSYERFYYPCFDFQIFNV